MTPDCPDAAIRTDDVVALLQKYPGVAESMTTFFDKEMYLHHGTIPAKYCNSKNSKKSWAKECRRSFTIIFGRLYHLSNTEVRQRVAKGDPVRSVARRGADRMDEQRRVISSAEALARALWAAHDSPRTGGHDGVDTVMMKMTRTLMLPRGVRELVKDYTKSCLCQSTSQRQHGPACNTCRRSALEVNI